MSSITTVKKENAGDRLDIFLTKKYKEQSRNYWQKKIKSGAVLVNGEKARVHEFLKAGDKVLIKKDVTKARDIKKTKLKYKLLHEEKDYLIVEKPAGLLTHSVEGELGLADQLAIHYPEIEGVGEKYRWGIVHRLDRDVSGVLLVAKTSRFFNHIKAQFKDRHVTKIYLALAYGRIERNEDEINFIIGRGEDGRMAARPQTQEGKEASTKIEVIERFKNYTYLRVQILTGRTHQIRAHMLAYGHPIVGDNIYKQKKQKIKSPCGLERIFLHSHIIGFKDLKNQEMRYESRLPRILKDCLKELK